MPVATQKRQPSPAKLQERDVTKQVRDFLVARGWRYIRMQATIVPGRFSTAEPGMADYLFIRYFRDKKVPYGVVLHLWIEMKSRTGRVGPKQKEWHEREHARGGCVWVVDDFSWFEGEYFAHFGYVHRAELGEGQLDLLAEVRA